MPHRIVTLALVTSLVAAAPSLALAQGRGGSTMSAFNSGGFGGGMGGTGGGFGNSGMGGGFGAGGMSGMGGGFGNSMGGMSGGFGNSGMGRSGFGNSGFGSSGVGGQRGGGQAFVGRDATDMQNTFMQSNRASTQFFNNMNRQMARQNRQQKAQGSSKNPSQVMRMEVQVGFTTTPPTADVVAKTLQTRLAKILAEHHMSMPLVTVQGDTAVLTGMAKSDSERAVIAQLVSLEAGVRAVRNEMTVPGEPPIEDTASPPGS